MEIGESRENYLEMILMLQNKGIKVRSTDVAKALDFSKPSVSRAVGILKEDGYEVVSGPRTTGDGYYESCIVGIEGNQIEITI